MNDEKYKKLWEEFLEYAVKEPGYDTEKYGVPCEEKRLITMYGEPYRCEDYDWTLLNAVKRAYTKWGDTYVKNYLGVISFGYELARQFLAAHCAGEVTVISGSADNAGSDDFTVESSDYGGWIFNADREFFRDCLKAAIEQPESEDHAMPGWLAMKYRNPMFFNMKINKERFDEEGLCYHADTGRSLQVY